MSSLDPAVTKVEPHREPARVELTTEPAADPTTDPATTRPDIDEIPEKSGRNAKTKWLAVVGAILLLYGLISLGLIGWEYYSTESAAVKNIEVSRQEVKKTWETTTGEAVSNIPGQGFGLLRIPYLGPTYEQPILVGVNAADIDRGVGWFPQTAKPGEIGNFAVAGHRGINNLPFSRLPDVPAGEKVIVETRDAIYTYVLDLSAKDMKVMDTDLWVLDPDPINKSSTATKATITLVTCYNLVRSPERAIAFGHLVETQKKV